MQRKYGCIRDTIDQRDRFLSVPRGVTAALPKSVDLRPGCSAVEDQGELGSCTANAIVGGLEFLEHKQNQTFIDLSRLFVYYNERVIEGTVNEDSGAQLRDGIKSVVKLGACPEKLVPYDVSKFKVKPAPAAYTAALLHQVQSYSRVAQTAPQLKGCLAAGYPFVFGFSVYESFESQTVARTGVMPIPRPSERCLGGHAVLAVGYADAKKTFIVRNSWGSSWGQKGYFTMPYECMFSPMVSDIWTMRIIE